MANKKVSQLTSKPSVLTTDLFPIADPSTGQLYKTTISDLGTAIGSGVSSVNGLVGAVVLDTDDIQELVSPTNKWFTDTRARAALSASSPLTYNSGTGVFGIQVANGSQNGYLSSTDWTTFNSKQAALSGTGFVKSTGGTISYDTNTYLTTTNAAATYLPLGGGTMTGALFGASASFSGYVGFNGNTSPLYPVDVAGSGRFSGDLRIESTNPRIYLTDTDNNPDYFISNTDGTFTIYDVTNSTSRFTIGTTGNATFTNAITGGGSITGQSLYSNGIISAGSSVSATRLILTGGTSPTGLYFGHTDKVVLANYTVGGGIDFETNGGNITMQLSSVGNLSTTGTIDSNGTTISINSASYPKIRLNDTNTGGGIYYWQSIIGKIRLVDEVAGAERFSISSTGAATFSSSVTATQGYFSNLSGDTITLSKNSGPSIQFAKTDATAQSWALAGEGTAFKLYNYTAGTTPFLVTTGGNVGIGTTSPNGSYTLTINGNSSSITGGIVFRQSSTDTFYIGNPATTNTTDFELWNPRAGYMRFATDNTERMRITSGGNVLIGTTSDNGSKLQVQGDVRVSGGFAFANQGVGGFFSWYGTTNIYAYNSAYGNIATINNSSGAYTALSDVNKKKDFEESTIGLAEVMQLKPKLFRMKKDSNSDAKQLGFIAQEVKDFIPQAYTETSEGFIGLQDRPIIAALTKAVQELKAELDTLKNK